MERLAGTYAATELILLRLLALLDFPPPAGVAPAAAAADVVVVVVLARAELDWAASAGVVSRVGWATIKSRIKIEKNKEYSLRKIKDLKYETSTWWIGTFAGRTPTQ